MLFSVELNRKPIRPFQHHYLHVAVFSSREFVRTAEYVRLRFLFSAGEIKLRPMTDRHRDLQRSLYLTRLHGRLCLGGVRFEQAQRNYPFALLVLLPNVLGFPHVRRQWLRPLPNSLPNRNGFEHGGKASGRSHVLRPLQFPPLNLLGLGFHLESTALRGDSSSGLGHCTSAKFT